MRQLPTNTTDRNDRVVWNNRYATHQAVTTAADAYPY